MMKNANKKARLTLGVTVLVALAAAGTLWPNKQAEADHSFWEIIPEYDYVFGWGAGPSLPRSPGTTDAHPWPGRWCSARGGPNQWLGQNCVARVHGVRLHSVGIHHRGTPGTTVYYSWGLHGGEFSFSNWVARVNEQKGVRPNHRTPSFPSNPPPPPPTQLAPAPTPEPPEKVCTSRWTNGTRTELLARLRWESYLPYEDGFTNFHHPEVPGGNEFWTPARTSNRPAPIWLGLANRASLNVWDKPPDENGCLWTATRAGVRLKEVLAHEPADLAYMKNPPSTVAAAAAAQQAAALWERLGASHQQYFRTGFKRADPQITWCAPAELPPWTVPPEDVLTQQQAFTTKYQKCRWEVPRSGLWKWDLRVEYRSELGHFHTEILEADLSWFRELPDYITDQYTWWGQ